MFGSSNGFLVSFWYVVGRYFSYVVDLSKLVLGELVILIFFV